MGLAGVIIRAISVVLIVPVAAFWLMAWANWRDARVERLEAVRPTGQVRAGHDVFRRTLRVRLLVTVPLAVAVLVGSVVVPVLEPRPCCGWCRWDSSCSAPSAW